MHFVHIIDDNGLFVEDAFVEELTDRTILEPCSGGFYHPRWDGTQWAEGGSPPEPQPVLPTEAERMEAAESAILALAQTIYGGGE